MANRIIAAVTMGSALALSFAFPASAVVDENYWAGTWESHHKGTHVMMVYLRQTRGSEDVYGTYRHPHDENGDRGHIQATAEGDYGKTLEGTYKSSKGNGGGHFTLHLDENLNSWKGKFWPCTRFCRGVRWTGYQPGFGP